MECFENVDEKLVQLVMKNDNIYNKNNYTFKNKKTREQTWDSIADTLKRPRLECQQRWNVLRTRYALEKRKCRIELKQSSWPLYESMCFLDKFMLPRRSYGSYKGVSTTSELSPTCSIWDIKPQIHAEEICVDPDTPSEDYDDKLYIDESNKDSIHSFDQYPNFNPHVFNKLPITEDAESAFGRTIALMLKNIRGHKKRRKVQAEIMQVLTNYDSGSDAE